MISEFTDSELISRFGNFNIRVYHETYGKETVVLWSKEISIEKPILTRVHSECLTGDVFGSLHCDCGQQLIKSLRLIGKEHGVFVYLRQEGRGIGLVEKIKAYKLQSQGKDTCEANLLLGHNPDVRSYKMVKTVLEDLNIKKVKLLTNNPSKVADIFSLGVEVSEVVNLVIPPCKYNRSYLKTKQDKFSHLKTGENAKYQYQYQFYASDPKCICEIGSFLRTKTIDPFLKICAAIRLDCKGLHDPKQVDETTAIIEACSQSQTIHPVLHFSFATSLDYQSDLIEIKAKFPLIEHIQLNDFDLKKVFLVNFMDFKKIDLSLSGSNFDEIKNPKIRRMIKRNFFLVVLDESKGSGKKPELKQLKEKIDVLLSCGMNRIGLAGGFGPDSLDHYFQIKRFYRINFSVDSETGVKTEMKTDAKKVILYLTQLMRSDSPKENAIQQTRNFLSKNRRTSWEDFHFNGYSFRIHPNVFHAGKFPSTAWFIKELQTVLKGISTFCEVGCGAGVIACYMAISDPTLKVVATDLNPDASENTKLNVQALSLSGRISVRQGDVLDSLQPTEQFDVIFWALPFGYLDPGIPIDLEEAQVFDSGYRAIRKLIYTAKQHLSSRGKLLLGFSSDLGHYELLRYIASEVNASLRTIAKTVIQEEDKVHFEIIELLYA